MNKNKNTKALPQSLHSHWQTTKSLTSLFTLTGKPLARTLCTATETRTQKLERIAEKIRDLTKLERYDYSVLWRHKMGLNKYGPAVSRLGPSAASGFGAGSGVEAKATEKSAFNLKLEKYDAAAKIKIIKEVRTFTDLGLKEAKELVEKVPVVLKKGLTKEEVSPKVSLLLVFCRPKSSYGHEYPFHEGNKVADMSAKEDQGNK